MTVEKRMGIAKTEKVKIEVRAEKYNSDPIFVTWLMKEGEGEIKKDMQYFNTWREMTNWANKRFPVSLQWFRIGE